MLISIIVLMITNNIIPKKNKKIDNLGFVSRKLIKKEIGK
jgi:hypothetical protein